MPLGIWTCTQAAWQFRVISPRRCICKNSITKRNFKAGSWISKLKFAQKRRISRSYCSGSRDRSNQLAEGPHQSEIKLRKRFLWLWRIRFDDGSRIEMVLRYCLIWSTKLPSVEPWQDKKGEKLLHRAKDWRMFSAEDSWVLFKKRRL